MHYDEMTALIEAEFQKIRDVRETKGREYASEGDTLADFKEVAEESGVSPLQVWAVYVKKHQRAIDTFIREGHVKSETIESRIMDVIVYHFLLLGLIKDLENADALVGVVLRDVQARERVEVAVMPNLGPDPMWICVGGSGDEHDPVSGPIGSNCGHCGRRMGS